MQLSVFKSICMCVCASPSGTYKNMALRLSLIVYHALLVGEHTQHTSAPEFPLGSYYSYKDGSVLL